MISIEIEINTVHESAYLSLEITDLNIQHDNINCLDILMRLAALWSAVVVLAAASQWRAPETHEIPATRNFMLTQPWYRVRPDPQVANGTRPVVIGELVRG